MYKMASNGLKEVNKKRRRNRKKKKERKIREEKRRREKKGKMITAYLRNGYRSKN